MRKFTKRSAVIAAVAAVAVGGAGAAYATWSLNSSDQAQTVAGSATRLEVTGLTIVGTLVPGTPASVKFTAKNSNGFPVTVSKVSFSDVHTSDETNCPTNNLVAPDVAANLGFGAGETKSDITFANAVRLKTNPDNGCQSATFAFKVNLTVASNANV
ncbi:hypothetical protein [Mycobacterium sp.]|uniref:hypothetical protein n=1 Tax=Mycobacterium sp. TaxID=1785 RepID=UPI0026025073|nr:hypothetical protein [Mycobacterium sp.]